MLLLRDLFDAEKILSGVIFRNHPWGNPSPSADDRQVTQEMHRTCGLKGISSLDHIVIGGNGYFSFAEHRLL